MPDEIQLLPVELPWREAIKIYLKRLGVYFAVVIASVIIALVLVRIISVIKDILILPVLLQIGFALVYIFYFRVVINFGSGVLKWVASGGDYRNITSGQKKITSAIIGLIVNTIFLIIFYVLKEIIK